MHSVVLEYYFEINYMLIGEGKAEPGIKTIHIYKII